MMNRFIEKDRSTFKLAASYLAVIMVMSVAFSLILYFTSTHNLEKPPNLAAFNTGQKDADHVIDEWLGRRADDNRAELATRLLILNIVTLFVGACLSYYLARKTLKPIENVMRDQERFIADASHELRTPLTSILLSNEVALRKKGMTVADARRIIVQNVSDINELKTLSDELLDVSLDTREPNIRSNIDLGSLTKDIQKQIASIAKEKTIKVIIDDTDIRLRTDKSMLSKVIVILLDNAIKYSPDHSNVHVTFSDAGKGITITVSDKGIGITRQNLTHIFERFYRADTSRSQIEGHGLGLAIATKLVAKLRGELSAESTIGKGSKFTIWLPK